MTLTEYAKDHEYIFLFGGVKKEEYLYCSRHTNIFKIFDYGWDKYKEAPRVYGAVLSEKPKLTFKDIKDLVYERFGYGYDKIQDYKIIEEITEDKTALDIINNILANQLVQFPSYEVTDEEIELTDDELEEYFNIKSKKEN